jgi:hypothetical protein
MDAMSCFESSAFLRKGRMSWGRNETGGNEDGEIAGVGDVLLVGGEMEDWLRCQVHFRAVKLPL